MDTVIVPTRRSRIIASLKIATWPLIALLAFLAGRHHASHVQHLPVCDSMPWLRGYAVAAILIALGCSLYFARAGALTWRSRQHPHPGASVLFTTKASTGFWAQLNAAALLAFSLLFAFALIKLLAFFAFSELGFYLLGLRDCVA